MGISNILPRKSNCPLTDARLKKVGRKILSSRCLSSFKEMQLLAKVIADTLSTCTWANLSPEFYAMDLDVLLKALQVLVKRGKAQIFGNQDEQGVKFF